MTPLSEAQTQTNVSVYMEEDSTRFCATPIIPPDASAVPHVASSSRQQMLDGSPEDQGCQQPKGSSFTRQNKITARIHVKAARAISGFPIGRDRKTRQYEVLLCRFIINKGIVPAQRRVKKFR